jgi:hypothetical protein
MKKLISKMKMNMIYKKIYLNKWCCNCKFKSGNKLCCLKHKIYINNTSTCKRWHRDIKSTRYQIGVSKGEKLRKEIGFKL